MSNDIEKAAESWWNSIPEFDGPLKGEKKISASKTAAVQIFLAGAQYREPEIDALKAELEKCRAVVEAARKWAEPMAPCSACDYGNEGEICTCYESMGYSADNAEKLREAIAALENGGWK